MALRSPSAGILPDELPTLTLLLIFDLHSVPETLSEAVLEKMHATGAKKVCDAAQILLSRTRSVVLTDHLRADDGR